MIASVGSSLLFVHLSAQTRRFFGSIGSSQNLDALAAQDMDNVSEEENFEACVAYRKAERAKKNSSDGGSRDSFPKYSKGKIKNAANYRSGEIYRVLYITTHPSVHGKGAARAAHLRIEES